MQPLNTAYVAWKLHEQYLNGWVFQLIVFQLFIKTGDGLDLPEGHSVLMV